jgi:hypothetical protein
MRDAMLMCYALIEVAPVHSMILSGQRFPDDAPTGAGSNKPGACRTRRRFIEIGGIRLAGIDASSLTAKAARMSFSTHRQVPSSIEIARGTSSCHFELIRIHRVNLCGADE